MYTEPLHLSSVPCLINLTSSDMFLKYHQGFSVKLILPLHPDPARVINMPPVIYVPRKLPGIIRCPVDANPPVTSVKWEKDGYPLRVEKVCVPLGFVYPFNKSDTSLCHWICLLFDTNIEHHHPMLHLQIIFSQ